MARLPKQQEIKVPGRKKHWVLRLTLILLVLPAALFAGYVWIGLHFAYSSGERSGYVQKISKKGWFCKTWEGELAMITTPGTVPQIFQFSVQDEGTAHQIEDASGKRVTLSYDQHKGIPTSCFGETEYFVTGVRVVGR
jgi:hypothetical protein